MGNRWWMLGAAALCVAIGCQHTTLDMDGVLGALAFFFGGAAAVHFTGQDAP
jgi:hypothetical protein